MMRHPGESAIQRYLDGDSSPLESRRLERHFAKCGDCRAIREEYRGIRTMVGRLGDWVEPPVELWSGIAMRIEGVAPGGAEEPVAVPSIAGVHYLEARRSASGAVFGRRSYGMRFVAAITAAAAILVLGVALGRQLPRSPGLHLTADGGEELVPAPAVLLAGYDEVAYESAIADLEQILRSSSGALQPETIAVVEENLRIIDQAIADSRAALLADPANQQLHRSLATNMQAKIEVLRMVTAAATRDI